MLENELGPYRNGEDHVALTGADIDLPPRYVLALGMTAHELTTNAAKHGALSTGAGRVHVDWQVLLTEGDNERLSIRWLERGGPPVAAPTRRVFGSRLITGGTAREMAGEVPLEFQPEGLLCTIDVPLASCPTTSLH